MEEYERGRLYPIKADGSEMAPFIIKKHVLYIGSGDSCGIRIYTDGIYPEHCVLTIGKKGKVYFEPLHPAALTLVNHHKITEKCLLKQNDVITILAKSFRFAVRRQISVKVPVLPSVARKTISPKHRMSSTRKSISPKRMGLPNVDDNLHMLCVKRPMTGMVVEQNVQKKKRLSVCEKKVRFGPKLTPEEFDKRLPPSSPLRRGSLPGETHSKSIQKHRLSSQLSPNTSGKRRAHTKRLASGSKRSSFPLQSAKMSRGSPLVDKSLNVSNDSSTTFTVNAEVISGFKSKIETPIKSIPSRKRRIPFSSMEYGDFEETSSYSVPSNDVTKLFDSPVSKNTSPNFDKSSSNLKIHKEFSDASHVSKLEDIETDSNIASDLSAVDKQPLFSEVLKKNKTHSDEVLTASQAKSPKLNTCLKKTSKYMVDNQKISEQLIHRQILTVGSTGHANSPETIILRKRKIAEVADISNDVINVRRSPRTPRRANYNKVINKMDGITLTISQQQNNNTVVEQVEKKSIAKITTPSRKVRKTQEFLPQEFLNLALGEMSEENGNVQLECTDVLCGKFYKEELKQDIESTPNQQRKCRTSGDVEFIKKQDPQFDDLCITEKKIVDEMDGITLTVLQQHNNNTVVEQVEKKSIAKITTPSKKIKQLKSNFTYSGEISEEKGKLQLECTDVLSGNFYEEELKQDIASPNQQRKCRKSGVVEIIKKQDSQFDDLRIIEKNKMDGITLTVSQQQNDNTVVEQEEKKSIAKIATPSRKVGKTRELVPQEFSSLALGEMSKEKGDLQLECTDVLSGNFYGEELKQDIKASPNQPRKCRKSEGVEIIKKQDSQFDDLCITEKNDDDEVKDTKKQGNKKPRRGRKLLQVSKENKDVKLDVLIKPGKYLESSFDASSQENCSLKEEDVKETKKIMKQSRKGRKLLRVPQEDKDTNPNSLTSQSDYPENIIDLKSSLMDCPSNEKENVKIKGKKPVKQTRNKKGAKVLNENEEIQLMEDVSDLDHTSKKTVDLKSRCSDDVPKSTHKILKTNMKNIDKPSQKRNAKKESSTGKESKPNSLELSPCRRVTRSMAKNRVQN